MPIRYNIDTGQRVVLATPYGLLTDTEVFDYQKEVWSRPDISGYNELVDMTGVSQIASVSGARLEELARLSSSMDPPASSSRLAIVATTDLHFGLARMYQARREMASKGAREVRVFRSRQ